jgi:hypothetical protein
MKRRSSFLPSDFQRMGQYEWHQATHARRRLTEDQALIEAQAEIRELGFVAPRSHKDERSDS